MKSLSRVQLLATPWTVAYQALPSMGFFGTLHSNGYIIPFLLALHTANLKTFYASIFIVYYKIRLILKSCTIWHRASQVAIMVKNLPANAGDIGDTGSTPESTWRKKWQPTPVFLPGESRGQRSLVGYSP